MNAMLNPTSLVVRRVIAAPAGEIFDAWLDPQALSIWMRPGSIRRTTATLEARVGGRYEIVMEADDRSIPHTGEYRVIDRPRRLAFTWHSPHTGGRHTLVTVDFLPIDQHTEVVITHEQLPEGEYEGHRKGWSSALDNLLAMLERAAAL